MRSHFVTFYHNLKGITRPPATPPHVKNPTPAPPALDQKAKEGQGFPKKPWARGNHKGMDGFPILP